MTPYTINDLPALASLTANDYIPVWDSEASGEPTYKIKVSDMIASMVLIASLLKQDDVVNDLTSTATDKPGSANMLKTLNDKLSLLGTMKKVSYAQGANVTFTYNPNTTNRYAALLFVVNNDGSSGIFAITYKQGTGSTVEKLSGLAGLPTVDNNGNITTILNNWSEAVLLATNINGFS